MVCTHVFSSVFKHVYLHVFKHVYLHVVNEEIVPLLTLGLESTQVLTLANTFHMRKTKTQDFPDIPILQILGVS